MSNIWFDGFDHYGSGSSGLAAMLDGAYAEVSGAVGLSSSIHRTGAYGFQVGNGSNNAVLRRVFGVGRTEVGVGFGLYLPNLPTASGQVRLLSLRDTNNGEQVRVTVNTDGVLSAWRGGTLLGVSDGPAVTAAAWQHFECFVKCDPTVGAVEARVNQVTKMNLIGVNTQGQATTNMTQWAAANVNGPGSGAAMYIDDLYAWDTAGSYNNDFIGDKKVYPLFPDADTASADWSLSSGSSGYDLINDAAPDDDSGYIYTNSVGDTSVFGLEDLPPEVSQISAVYVVHRSMKEDAGDCNVQTALVSNAAEAAGADRPITTIYTYWGDVIEADPDTGAPWTRSGVNAALLKIKRTA